MRERRIYYSFKNLLPILYDICTHTVLMRVQKRLKYCARMVTTNGSVFVQLFPIVIEIFWVFRAVQDTNQRSNHVIGMSSEPFHKHYHLLLIEVTSCFFRTRRFNQPNIDFDCVEFLFPNLNLDLRSFMVLYIAGFVQ